MNPMQKKISKIVIVGAGPAGSSLAIRLAQANFEVTLIEREKFPRHKLCGEFISPECLEYFRELDVLGDMFAVNGDRIFETVFYDPDGKHVSIQSKWFRGAFESALSISRAEMDFRLLQKAKAFGAEILEESNVFGLNITNGIVGGVKIRKPDGTKSEINGDLIIDATGRAAVLTKLVDRRIKSDSVKKISKNSKAKYVGFKTHLRNVNMQKGACEIYFFRGGYGGLSFVENGYANHCFLVKADLVKEFDGNADKIVENVVLANKRAAITLKDAENAREWLAVSVDEFGKKRVCPASGILSIGDASAFIDPFTGSGMLMALEGAELLANLLKVGQSSLTGIEKQFESAHEKRFKRRLRVCSVMRYAAFSPVAAKFVIALLGFSRSAQELLTRATRRLQPND